MEENDKLEVLRRQLKEFNERCKTMPEYACYRDEEWLKKNATYRT